ncbi:MAG: hypothetical protein AAFY60_19165, partial [Myxococcota bacterium]
LYTAYIFGAPNNQQIAGTFFDLRASQSFRRVVFNETLGDVRFSPDGSLALVQHDTGSAQTTDYQFLDLCSGNLGDAAGPLLTNFSNSDPYNAIYEVAGTSRSVDFTVGTFNTTVTADPCFSADPGSSLALFVEVELVPVSPANTLLDVVFSYEVGADYDSATLNGRLPAVFEIVSDPMNLVDSDRNIQFPGLEGTGELSLRVDYGAYGSACIGTRLNNISPYSLLGVRTVADGGGGMTQVFSTQFGASSCTEGPDLVVREIRPDSVLPRERFPVTLEYENVGDLVIRDVLLKVVLDGRADVAAILITGDEDPSFSRPTPVSAEFDLGDINAGRIGQVTYFASASCAATDLGGSSGSIQLLADPGPTWPFVQTGAPTIQVTPFVEGQMDIEVVA